MLNIIGKLWRFYERNCGYLPWRCPRRNSRLLQHYTTHYADCGLTSLCVPVESAMVVRRSSVLWCCIQCETCITKLLLSSVFYNRSARSSDNVVTTDWKTSEVALNFWPVKTIFPSPPPALFFGPSILLCCHCLQLLRKGVIQPKREADLSLISSVKAKISRYILLLPHNISQHGALLNTVRVSLPHF